jgi:mitochondrial ribonuclease P protein 3
MIIIRKLVARNFNQIRTLKTPKYIKVNIEDTFNFHQEDPNKINWENVRKDLLNGRNVNEKNIDGIIVGFCSRVKRLDLAKSYFDFIKSQNYLPSDGASAKYLRSIWSHKQANKSFQINHDEINNICDNLVKRNKFLHPELADNIITGYCSTKYWLKSFDIIDKLKKDEIETGPAIYSPIISAAIENNDLKLVWKLIDKVIEENSAPSAFRVLEFFDKFYDNVNEIEKMLSIISELNMIFSDELVNQFKEIFDRKFDAKIVNIKRNGICHSCHSKLPSVDLNREEFEKLSKNFHEEVFVRKDVFCQTTPKELERFKNFVEKTKPYHCVIDGLNVAYSHGNQNTTKFYSGNIVSVVQHFKKLNQNILVIGRQHMLKWPKVDIDYIKKNSHFFVAQDM